MKGFSGVGYFWRGRDIFQGETNKVVSRVVLPVKQPEFLSLKKKC